MFNPVQLGSNFARNAIIRYAPLAVGLMTIEHLFRSTAPAVGLKPSAMECKARLRGLWRIMYSKTIRPRPGKAKPARAPRHTGATPAYPGMRAGRPRPQAYRRDARAPRHAGATPAPPGMQARRLHTQACGCDARAPRHAGATPAPPGMQAQRLRAQACGCDARAPRHASATPAHPGMRAGRPRTQACAGRNNAGTIVGCPGGKAPYRIKIWHQVGATCAR